MLLVGQNQIAPTWVALSVLSVFSFVEYSPRCCTLQLLIAHCPTPGGQDWMRSSNFSGSPGNKIDALV